MKNTYATIVAVSLLHNIAITHCEQDFPEDMPAAELGLHPDIPPIDQPRGIAFRRAFIEANFAR